MSKRIYILSDHPCDCGCGQLTNLAPFTWAARGLVKGQPIRFVPGHYRRDLMIRPPLSERFAVHFEAGEVDACWPWKGSRDKYGYGYLVFNGKALKAHRVSYEFFGNPSSPPPAPAAHVGPVPQGLGVLHRCDNPPCVNYLSHLFPGTQLENIADMNQKGRGNQGERNPMAKLNRELANEIRQLCKQGVGRIEIARRYSTESYTISPAAVSDIEAGRTWKEAEA